MRWLAVGLGLGLLSACATTEKNLSGASASASTSASATKTTEAPPSASVKGPDEKPGGAWEKPASCKQYDTLWVECAAKIPEKERVEQEKNHADAEKMWKKQQTYEQTALTKQQFELLEFTCGNGLSMMRTVLHLAGVKEPACSGAEPSPSPSK